MVDGGSGRGVRVVDAEEVVDVVQSGSALLMVSIHRWPTWAVRQRLSGLVQLTAKTKIRVPSEWSVQPRRRGGRPQAVVGVQEAVEAGQDGLARQDPAGGQVPAAGGVEVGGGGLDQQEPGRRAR